VNLGIMTIAPLLSLNSIILLFSIALMLASEDIICVQSSILQDRQTFSARCLYSTHFAIRGCYLLAIPVAFLLLVEIFAEI
jgi:hypothetical protein